MKKLTQLIIICFASLVICSFKIDNSQNELTISAQFINLENPSVEAVLWNNTSDTIGYLTWDCSWQASYRTDNKDLSFQQDLCWRDSQVIIKIPPHESVKKILHLINTNRIHGIKFRIGFNYINPIKDQKPLSKMEELKRHGAVIWSNSLLL